MRFGHQTVVLVGNATQPLSLTKRKRPDFRQGVWQGNAVRASNGGFGGKRDSAAELSKRKTPRLSSRRMAGEMRFGHQTVVLVGNATQPLSLTKRKRPDFRQGVWQGNAVRASNGGFGGKRDSAAELSKRKTPRLLSRRLAEGMRFEHQTVVLVGNATLSLS